MHGGMASELEVCQVTSTEVVRDFILDYCQKLEWAHGKLDYQLYWDSGPQPGEGVYVGSLAGQPITAVGMFQHNDSYAFVGFYFCKEEYRGRGYGFKTWKVAQASLRSDINLGLDAEEPAIHLYKREGFKRAFDIFLYSFPASSVLEAYGNIVAIPEGITVKPCASVDFRKLKAYTEEVIGFTFDRSSILENWISLPTHTALAAVKENGDIAGFAAIRESVKNNEPVYRLAPLLADDGTIARVLICELVKPINPQHKLIFSVLDTNPEAKKIAEDVKGECYSLNVRMYNKYDLPIDKGKYFGIFGPNLTG